MAKSNKSSNIASFSSDELEAFLLECKVKTEFCKVLKDEEFDGEAFLEITRSDLEDLFPNKLGVVLKLISIQKKHASYDKRCSSTDFENSDHDSVSLNRSSTVSEHHDSLNSNNRTPHKEHDSLNNNERIQSFTEEAKPEFLKFIEKISLYDKYPQKLQLKDCLLIRQDVSNDDGNFPYLILQNIMMYNDYRPLCKSISEKLEFKIHPIDVLIALLHCCDNILRQDLLSRLIRCQLSIPFLLSDPNNKTITLLVWAMRSIVCEWKCKTDTAITSEQCCIVDCKAPIVLFLRIGSAKSPKDFSKSRTLNTVIGDQNYFFHWNCPGGKLDRKFVKGLVELSYYLPSGKANDVLSKVVFFLNLRGDARQHIMQLGFLKKIAFMVFAFFLEENLDDSVLNLIRELAVMPGGVVMMFPNSDHIHASQISNCPLCNISESKITPLNIRGENEDDIKSKIREHISTKVSNADASKFKSIKECAAFAQEVGIKVDEDDKECKKGYTLANEMVETLKSVPATDAKAELLPLQGPELWQNWATFDKKSFKKPNKDSKFTVASHNQDIDQKKREIRKMQHTKVKKPSTLMKYFTNNLQTCSIPVRNYFLQWLKLFLDDRSRTILPTLRADYEKIRAELKQLTENGKLKTDTNANTLTNKLKKQSKKLTDGSLGLEHFFRELGQTYEACKECNNQQHDVDCYPKIMVEILNQGYPVELMDGDASHVPITWVLAVLNELAKHHSKKKVFVISILGIQSTGKSTLLNAMFGLQFYVSAGRCTRGAFMQLLPVKETSNSTMKTLYDFVLIIDTEGLRAPELRHTDLLLHDNELATFVIGLADVAIINISGETPGDLNDILQIAVHAFIRMKEVSMNLSCHFVHQNVADILVDSKIGFSQQCFQDRLNEMTKYAAIAEHCESKYKSFQDVIKFDGEKDTTHFPGLWKGNPPMATVNPAYCEKALQLKTSLLTHTGENKSYFDFTNFQSRIQKLWYAVCRENYIFSFKSTLEIVAYNNLDVEFSQWSWTLYRKIQDWQFFTGNYIRNCPSTQIAKAVAECLENADRILNEMHSMLNEQMTIFFENSEHAQTLAQWKARYQIRLDTLRDESKTEAKQQCDLFKHNRECRLKLESIQKNHRQQLIKHIKELVANAKQSNKTLTMQELQKKFDGKWQVWMSQFGCISSEYKSMYIDDKKIELVINDILQELLNRYNKILNSKLSKFDLLTKENCDLSLTIDQAKHVRSESKESSKTGGFKKVVKWLGFGEDTIVDKIQNESDKMFIEAKHAVRKVRKNFQNFNKAFPYGLLKKFIDDLEHYNQTIDHAVTSEYIVDMTLIFARYMTTEFTKLMIEVRDREDPVVSFQKSRDTYFDTFLAQYKSISGSDAVANHLYRVLKVAIGVAVKEILPIDIVDQMKSNPCYSQKNLFKVKILKDLANQKKFKLYTTYLVDIKSSFEYWAEQYVKEFCMQNSKDNLKKATKSIIQETKQYITTVVKNLDETIPIKEWWQQFHERLNQKLKLDFNEMHDIIEAADVEGISSEIFVKTLSQKLEQIEEKVMKQIEDQSSEFSDITKWNASPHLLLCDHLIGCTEQCPFCKEQCELADPNHVAFGKEHYIEIHRPECLGKYTWNTSKELVLDLCTSLVESPNARFRNHDTGEKWVPYKDYKTIYKDWCIANENPTEVPKYWLWFIKKFGTDIKKWAGATSMPFSHPDWKFVKKDAAIASLSKVYKIN